MAMASKTSPLPTLTETTCRSCWAMARAVSALRQTSPLAAFPLGIAVGDFNGDGKQDLAVANDWSNNVSILLGDGAGNFSAPTNFRCWSDPAAVAVGDFNGDGKQDLAVANDGSDNVSILFGDGTRQFQRPTNFGVGAGSCPSVAVGDFNGDGKQDLAIANQPCYFQDTCRRVDCGRWGRQFPQFQFPLWR